MTDDIDPIFVKVAKDAERSIMTELQQDCISLRVALATARDQFRRYQGQHEAKGMDTKRTETERQQAREKGETNRAMAAMCQAAINGSRKRTPSQNPSEADAAATVRTIEAAADAGLLPSRITGRIKSGTVPIAALASSETQHDG